MTQKEQDDLLTRLDSKLDIVTDELSELKAWKNQIEGAYKAIVIIGTIFGVILGVVATLIATYTPIRDIPPRQAERSEQVYLIPEIINIKEFV